MSIILYLDTTSDILKIGLSREGEMIARFSQQSTSHRYHSAIIIPSIQQVLKEAGLSPEQLTSLAINPGPGSFTGVRTGISTARTMGQFLKIPVFVINSFEVIAWQVAAAEEPVTVIIDALRERLYTATLHFERGIAQYGEVPALRMQREWQPPHGIPWVSPSLKEQYPEAQAIEPERFTPDAMLAILATSGDSYRREWMEVKPLYLQEPNITVKKATTGRY